MDQNLVQNLDQNTMQFNSIQPESGFIDYSIGKSYQYISLAKLLADVDEGKFDDLKRQLSGKIVFLGSVLPLEDRHLVPVPLAAWEPDNHLVPGVLIHAQALRTYLSGGPIQPVPVVIILIVAVLCSSFWWLGTRPVIGITTLIVTTGFMAWGGSIMLLRGVFIPTGSLIAIAFISLFTRMAAEGAHAFLERRRLRDVFSPYVSPAVMTDILSGRIAPVLGGERRKICVLFSDVRGFTTLSESAPPEKIVMILNRYFDTMVESVHKYGGTVDKFIGDGLMVFFGAPNSSEHPVRDAFLCADEMLQRLVELNDSLKQDGLEVLQIGIGLHYGDAVVGHIGSSKRHEYTAIGDTVNLAARLEGLTKELNYPIVCSKTVADALAGTVTLKALGLVPVKGHSDAEVFGFNHE